MVRLLLHRLLYRAAAHADRSSIVACMAPETGKSARPLEDSICGLASRHSHHERNWLDPDIRDDGDNRQDHPK
jgi:hypothetical protein